MKLKDMNYTELVTLALAVATSWTEDHKQEPGRKIRRAWKGYVFEIMDGLEGKGFVRASTNSRSLQITEDGYRVGQLVLDEIKKALSSSEVEI